MAQQIAMLNPKELMELRTELASLPPDDPLADHDRAALACFDAMAGVNESPLIA
jgi:hypothetical protein